MTEPRRRVTYVIPPPAEPAPRLVLPPANAPRLGQAGPLLHPARDQPPPTPPSPSSSLPQHRLGVTCLALDTTTQLQNRAAPEGILYSGGKDGLVIAWDLGLPMRRHRRVSQLGGSTRGLARWEIMTGWADDAIDEEQEGEDRPTSDGDILGDVTISRRRANTITAPAPRWEVDRDALASASTNKPPRSQFRQSAQMHRDWVNDIVLCNQNQTVVSASSDGSVKAWNPHSLSDPVRIGVHADYVRCLTQCRTQSWVASGSFDRTIKIWDLGAPPSSEPIPLMTLSSHSTSDPLSPKIGNNAVKAPSSSSPKSSVYALAADPFGHTIASGSPERVVRLWDPRSGKRTGKLVGHTDNIRSILISEDSNYLWSLRSQRCLHTFTHHAESVWSLWSEHRSLEIFYSGDRAGLVCKVDVEDCADISEGECIVLCDDARHSPPTKSEGINRIVAADDTYLWTATGSASIKRWNVPPRRAERARAIFAAEEANCDASRGGEETHRSSSPDWQKAQDTASLNLSLSADHSTVSFAEPYDGRSKDGKDGEPHTGDGKAHASDGASTLYGIPFDSLVRLTSPNDPFTPYASMKNADPEVATLYSAASILSVPRAARSPGSAYFPHRRSHLPSPDSTMGRRQSQPSSHQPHHLVRQDTARTEYEARELAADAIPLNAEPLDIIEGTKGLVRSVILNDRTHVLTVDTEEEVAVWDILRCQCLGRWLREDIVKAMRSEEKEANNASGPQRRNSEHEHKAPLDEPRRSPRELLDAVRSRVEGEAAVPQWCSVETKVGVLAVHVSDRRWGDDGRCDHHSVNLGRWVLRNLFYEFIHEESRQQRARRHEPGSPASPASPTSTSHPPGPSRWPAGLVTVAPHIVPVLPPVLSPLAARSSPLITPMIPLAALGATQSGEATPVPERHLRAVTSAEVISPGREHDYFSVRGRRPSTAVGAVPVTPDETPRPTENGRIPDTPTTPSGLMGRLKNLGKTNKKTNDLTSPAPLETTEERQVHAQPVDAPPPETPSTPRQALLASQFTPPSSAEAPRYSLPHDVCVLITEESDTGPAAGGYKVVYRALVGRPDVRALEAVAPMWLLEYLLMNRAPIPPPVKLSFVLLPWPDKDGEKLPDLLNTAQSKLTASRYLRVRKLVVHVQDKLEKIRGGSRGGSISSLASAGGTGMGGAGLGGGAGVGAGAHPVERAEETYEVLCNNVVLPLDMTLAQVRQYVWRQAAELVIYYRKRVGSVSYGGRRSGEHHRGEQHAGDHRGHHRPEHRGEHLPSSGIGIQQQLAAAQQQQQEAAQANQETTPRPPAHIPSSMIATPHSSTSAHTGGRAHDAHGGRRSHDVAPGAKSPASPSSPRTKHVSSAFAGAAFSL
ncbi:hypothetical protein FB107DRAFT_263941 [Schizophyllum commune]